MSPAAGSSLFVRVSAISCGPAGAPGAPPRARAPSPPFRTPRSRPPAAPRLRPPPSRVQFFGLVEVGARAGAPGTAGPRGRRRPARLRARADSRPFPARSPHPAPAPAHALAPALAPASAELPTLRHGRHRLRPGRLHARAPPGEACARARCAARARPRHAARPPAPCAPPAPPRAPHALTTPPPPRAAKTLNPQATASDITLDRSQRDYMDSLAAKPRALERAKQYEGGVLGWAASFHNWPQGEAQAERGRVGARWGAGPAGHRPGHAARRGGAPTRARTRVPHLLAASPTPAPQCCPRLPRCPRITLCTSAGRRRAPSPCPRPPPTEAAPRARPAAPPRPAARTARAADGGRRAPRATRLETRAARAAAAPPQPAAPCA
jgi:hypothetical protein